MKSEFRPLIAGKKNKWCLPCYCCQSTAFFLSLIHKWYEQTWKDAKSCCWFFFFFYFVWYFELSEHCGGVLLLQSVFIRSGLSDIKSCKWLLVFQSRNFPLKRTCPTCCHEIFPWRQYVTVLKKSSSVSVRQEGEKALWRHTWCGGRTVFLGNLLCSASGITALFARSHPFHPKKVISF